MYVYVYMCICIMYVCIVCMYVCMYVCMHACMYVCMYAHVHVLTLTLSRLWSHSLMREITLLPSTLCCVSTYGKKEEKKRRGTNCSEVYDNQEIVDNICLVRVWRRAPYQNCSPRTPQGQGVLWVVGFSKNKSPTTIFASVLTPDMGPSAKWPKPSLDCCCISFTGGGL